MVWFLRAVLLRRAGNRARDGQDWPAAKAEYAAFLRLKPNNAAIWVQYGHAAKEGGDLGEAETAYRRAVEIAPRRADTHLQLGHLLKILGRFDEAEQAYRRALALDAGHAEAHLQLGHLLKDNDRLAEAELAYSDALQFDPSLVAARNELNLVQRKIKALKKPKGVPTHLRYVNIGTVGRCNASCRSCPSGKPETENTPKVPMPMALFEKLIRSIVDLDLVITNQISFGLFGDSLIDPHVVERAKLVRKLMPDAQLVVNTNGAAYNPARHKELFEIVTYLALHVESLVPETYHTLMHPLRAERVFPKVDQILEDFRGKVLISTPVSKLNVDELPAIKKHFTERDVVEVSCDPISSRCAEDQTVFRELALNPVLIQCPSEVLGDFIIDCDGTVLVCCQDFQRLEPIGNLAEQSLAEVLTDARRVGMRERFDCGRHAEMQTCRRCYADARAPVRESMHTGSLYQADLARNAGDWSRAKTAYQDVLQRQPARSDIWVQYGHACKNSGDLEAAEAAYRKAIELNPTGAEARLQLGHLLTALARLEEAGEVYGEALACAEKLYGDSSDPTARQTIRLCEAAKAIHLGDWPKVKEAYAELVRLQPKREDFWVQYGHAAKECGNLGEAETAYRQALAVEPDRVETQLHLSHLLKSLHRYDEAKAVFTSVLTRDPSCGDAATELSNLAYAPLLDAAQTAYLAGDWPKVRDAFRDLVELAPQRDDFWVQYGHAAKECGDREIAVAAYRQALSLAPAKGDALLHLAHLLKNMQRFDEAAEAFSAILARDPSNDEARRELEALPQIDWLDAADRARDTRDWPTARDAYRAFLRGEPRRDDVWVQYGHAAKESGDRAEAETAYRRALDLNPANADTWLQLGHLYKIVGRLDEAERAYAQSVACDPALESARVELSAISGASVSG